MTWSCFFIESVMLVLKPTGLPPTSLYNHVMFISFALFVSSFGFNIKIFFHCFVLFFFSRNRDSAVHIYSSCSQKHELRDMLL